MIFREQLLEIGKFQKTHALKGELNAVLEVDAEFFEEGNPIVVDTDGIYVPYFIESIRKKGSTSYLIKLEGVDSEEEAKTFVNKVAYALKESIKTFYGEEGEEILDSDGVKGFKVIDADSGVEIGEIIEVDDSTTNVLLHVKTEEGEVVFVPVVDEWIEEIDEPGKTFKMKFPDGLLDLNSKNKNQRP